MTIKKERKSDVAGLKKLFPYITVVLCDDTKVDIKPIKIKNLPKIYNLIEDFGGDWYELFNTEETKDSDEMTSKEESEFVKKISKLFVTATDNVIDFLVIATGLDKSFIEELAIKDGASLFEAVIEINDFRGLAKKVQSLVGKMGLINSVQKQ